MSTDSAHVLISRVCSNDCVFCTVAHKRKDRLFPKREQILGFIEQSAQAGVPGLVFSGLGEPTLDPDFENYLGIAQQSGFSTITLFTNGHRLSEERAVRYRRAGLTHVLLSMHGLQPGHDRNVQRTGSFASAVAALSHYLGAGLQVTVNTCLTRHNLDEIPGLIQLLRPYPIVRHVLSFPEWSGNAREHTDELLTIDEVAERATTLIPEEDGRTYFENLPYCQTLRTGREMLGATNVRLLDGRGIFAMSTRARRTLPDRCLAAQCPLRDCCPGFDDVYVTARGWGNTPTRIEAFLVGDPSQALRARSNRSTAAVAPASPKALPLVSVPAGVAIDGQFTVALRVQTPEDVAQGTAHYGARLRNLDVDLDAPCSDDLLKACAGYAVRFRVGDPRAQLTTRVLEAARRTRALFVVSPDSDVVRSLNLLTGFGFSVQVDPTPSEDADAPSRAAEFYLHSPLLTVPIEPFHSLLVRIVRGSGRDLWSILEEHPGSCYWVSEGGELTLSRRWHTAGFTCGRAETGLAVTPGSPIVERVNASRDDRTRADGACKTCAYFSLCRGFLRAVEPTRDCAAWQRAFALLEEQALGARELQASVPRSDVDHK